MTYPEYPPESIPPVETEVLPPMGASPEPPKKNNKTLIIILVVAAVLLLCCCCGTAGWFLWENGDDILYELDLTMLPVLLV